jgi:hypothetical protein
MLLVALLLSSVLGVLRGEEPEQPGPWYLISEAELRSIEDYRTISVRERRTWLSQVQGLRARAENSEARSKNLEEDLLLLNQALSIQREQNRSLRQSYDRSEAGHLTAISIKNGEIAEQKQAAARQAQETERYKGISRGRLYIIIALGVSWAAFFTVKLCRFFRLF